VPYSVEAGRFASEAGALLPRRAEVCRRFGLDPQLPVFLYCGKLIHKKRPLQLLQAYLEAGLQDRAQLVYVGEGALHAEIDRRSRDARAPHVRVLGFLNQTEMPLAYVMGEVLCLISDATETWGLVVNEARACGRPVVVSDTVGCAPDLVRDDDGWTVPLDDSSVLSRTLASVLERRTEWTAMGAKGRGRAGTHTYREMATGVLSALNSIGS
jgi:glycosyltransferase involved in cell wall biosynthesis